MAPTLGPVVAAVVAANRPFRRRRVDTALAVVVASVVILSACGSSPPITVEAESPTTVEATSTTETTTTETTTSTTLTLAAYEGDLRFAWPRDCGAVVSELVDKRGQVVELRYTLGVTARGEQTVLTFDDFLAESVQGRPLSPDQREAVATTFRLPALVIDADGYAVGTEGMDELIDDMVAMQGGEPEGIDRDSLAALTEQAVLTKYWGSWGGFWVDWQTIAGTQEEAIFEHDSGAGPYEEQVLVESFERTDDLAVLRVTTSLVDEHLNTALGGVFNEFLDGGDDLPRFSGERLTIIDALVDPETLVPTFVIFDQYVELTVDGETQSQREHREWVFDWSLCN